MEMQVAESAEDLTHVRLVGSLDLSGLESIKMKFLATVVTAKKHAIVDMSGVDLISSLSMGMFIESVQSLRGHGKKLVIYGCTPDVKQALVLARLEQMLNLVDTEADATAALA